MLTIFIAAALNYGVFRRQLFNTTPQYIMLYDMGAGSTVASIIGQFHNDVIVIEMFVHVRIVQHLKTYNTVHVLTTNTLIIITSGGWRY